MEQVLRNKTWGTGGIRCYFIDKTNNLCQGRDWSHAEGVPGWWAEASQAGMERNRNGGKPDGDSRPLQKKKNILGDKIKTAKNSVSFYL